MRAPTATSKRAGDAPVGAATERQVDHRAGADVGERHRSADQRRDPLRLGGSDSGALEHSGEAVTAAEAGAQGAGYVLLRLPYELKDLFREWLEQHEPLKAKHVMSRLQAMRGGKDNDARFGVRQRGEGEYDDKDVK